MSSAAGPSQAGSLVASVVDSAGAVTLKPCQVVPWLVPAASGAVSVDVEAASEEETEVASVAVLIDAAEASEAVTADSADHQTPRVGRAAADMTVTVETMETAAAAADTVDATTTEDTAAEAATAEAEATVLVPGATPCRLAKGTAIETEVETVETATETETGIVTAATAATTAATTRGNGHTKEDQATKANANCAATDDKTPLVLWWVS